MRIWAWLRRLRGTAGQQNEAELAVERVLHSQRALLRVDGGDVALVRVRDGTIELRLRGACGACPQRDDTVARVIEPALRRELDWVRDVKIVA